MLERGAVEGEVFHRGAVQALAPDEPQVTPRLAALVRHELIRPDRPQLAGEDALPLPPPPDPRRRLRRAPEGDPRRAPRALRRLARASTAPSSSSSTRSSATTSSRPTATAPSSAALDDETRALGERAARRLAAAGFRASARGDLGAAANLLGRAAALLPAESRERIEVVLALVEPLAALMRVAEVETLLEQAGRAAELLGDERLIARVNVEKAWVVVHATAEQWSETAVLAQVEEAIAVFERLGDDVAVARALEVVTIVHLYYGRLSEVAAASERGYRHAERAHAREAAGEASPGPGGRRSVGRDAARSDRGSARGGLAWARRTGSLGVEACATVRLGVARALRGDRVGGNELFDRGMSACAELGARIWAYQELGCWIWALTDDPGRRRGEAPRDPRRARRGREARDGRDHRVDPRRVPLPAGALRRGRRPARGGRRAGRGRRRRHPGACARGAGKALRPAAGSWTRPKPQLAKASRSRTRRSSSTCEATRCSRSARFCDSRGRKDEAAEATRQALAIWEAKGNVVHAERARALLARL